PSLDEVTVSFRSFGDENQALEHEADLINQLRLRVHGGSLLNKQQPKKKGEQGQQTPVNHELYPVEDEVTAATISEKQRENTLPIFSNLTQLSKHTGVSVQLIKQAINSAPAGSVGITDSKYPKYHTHDVIKVLGSRKAK
ncbi:hypothetical protein, partial [Yoonia sp.]|uniref:hypothetical protein n=1 Tax=Yoonia sp. TaxID=2212373 RepID=UPI00391ABB3C